MPLKPFFIKRPKYPQDPLGHFRGFMIFLVNLEVQGNFGHLDIFKGILANFRGLRVFWSFQRFQEYFNRFRGF